VQPVQDKSMDNPSHHVLAPSIVFDKVFFVMVEL
jgi:hypothetical protein